MEPSADDADVTAARRQVDRLVAAPAPTPAELAEARLALSRALDRADHPDQAMDEARAGIDGLAPAFHADPPALAAPMRALVSQYMAVARRTDRAPDRTLMLPIAAALGGVVAAEDSAEEATGWGVGGEEGEADPGGRP